MGNFVHRYSSDFVKYCKENKLRINLLDFLATQSSVEGVVSSVKRQFGRWPYVREDYAVNHEWVEKIIFGLGEGEPEVDAFATSQNHRLPVWWGEGGVAEDAFVQDW